MTALVTTEVAAPRRMNLMTAALIFKLSKLFPKAKRDANGMLPPARPRTTTAVNITRRLRSNAAKVYELKSGGRQKVRFRRYMRAAGSPLFARTVPT